MRTLKFAVVAAAAVCTVSLSACGGGAAPAAAPAPVAPSAAPNSPAAEPDGAMEGAIGAIGAADGAAGAGAAAGAAPPPQAESETVQTAAAATTANFRVRMGEPFRGMDGRRVVRRRGECRWDPIG